jgi:hypothetical protein
MRFSGARKWLSWVFFGAIYGLIFRLSIGYNSTGGTPTGISWAVLVIAPFVVGAITVFGLRHTRPSVGRMIVAPWGTVAVVLAVSLLTSLEGSICILLGSPLFFPTASIGGVFAGLILRLTNRIGRTLPPLLLLPFFSSAIEQNIPVQDVWIEDRLAVDVHAPAHTIWEQIRTARDIREEELGPSVANLIGVPRPLEGINTITPDGEVRFSSWDRGVRFRAVVTDRIGDRLISWRYSFDENAFPPGSLDDHVRIGGQYFDLRDTTFVLTPTAGGITRLEIVSHYRVTTDIDFYAVPVARFIARDFMKSILHLYQTRSERAASTL